MIPRRRASPVGNGRRSTLRRLSLLLALASSVMGCGAQSVSNGSSQGGGQNPRSAPGQATFASSESDEEVSAGSLYEDEQTAPTGGLRMEGSEAGAYSRTTATHPRRRPAVQPEEPRNFADRPQVSPTPSPPPASSATSANEQFLLDDSLRLDGAVGNDTFAERFDLTLGRQEARLETVLGLHSNGRVDCSAADAVVERICELAEEVCEIAEENDEVEAECTDGTSRCERARERVSGYCE